jgi:hypothetical protein
MATLLPKDIVEWRASFSYACMQVQRGPKAYTHSLIVNIFGTKSLEVIILARYCSVMFAHVSRDEILPTTGWCSASLPSTCQGVLGWHATWTMDRSKSCYWVPTTVSRPHTSRLLPMGNLEGWSLWTNASHTRNHRSVVCSPHTRHTDSRSSLSSSAASTLFSRWWWPLRTHIVTHSLSVQEL